MSSQDGKSDMENNSPAEDSVMIDKEDIGSVMIEKGDIESPMISKERTSPLLDINKNVGVKTDILHENKSRSSDLENPPLWGWVVIAAACVLMTPVAGIAGSWGNFVGPLTEEFGASKLVIGSIGSTPFALGLGLVPVSTILINKYGIRPVCLMGSLVWLVALISSSFVNSIYWLFLTYSVLGGIGINFAFNPTMILVGKYFPNKYQTLATCLATSGISLGCLIVNPIIGMAIKSLGWRTTWRIYSAVLLAIQLICISLYRNPPTTNERASEEKDERDVDNEKMEMMDSNKSVTTTETKKISTMKMVCNPGLMSWLVATLCWSSSFIFPQMYIVDFMKTSFGVEAEIGNQVLMVLGVSELAGRVVGGISGEKVKFSFTYLYAGFTIVGGILACITPFIDSVGWMYVYGFAVGITSGVCNSILFVTCMQLFGKRVGDNIWGYTNVVVAMGAAGGPILAGMVYDYTNSYTITFEIPGGLFILGGLVMLTIETMKKKFPLENGNQVENDEGNCEKEQWI